MFDDIPKGDMDDRKKDDYKVDPSLFAQKTVFGQSRKPARAAAETNTSKVIGLTALLFVIILAGAYLFFYQTGRGDKQSAFMDKPAATSSDILPVLPVNPGGDNGDERNGGSNGEIRAETISFADYYREPGGREAAAMKKLAAPLNVKSDAANFYELSRNIDLDAYVEDLNNSGFALMENPFGPPAGDFFATYKALNDRRLPLLITTDFLFYYYHSIIHSIFRSVESHVFFDYLWQINKELFASADSRYREQQKISGIAGDPLLEAMRREAAFFAVTLELLKPRPGQFDDGGKTRGEKFTASDVDKYDFILPDYLRIDVPRETDLIVKALSRAKSPVLLYEQDYAAYKTPPLYRDSAKLNNYFLATRWLNSLFPLYPRGEKCPDCLLDQDDWLINFAAASLVAQDFSRDQKLKNDWAKIYKVLSYYSGLRRELTYLHYDGAWREKYGGNYDVKDVFSVGRDLAEARARELAGLIGDKEFLGIEGGLGRGDTAGRAKLGMRMLQEAYWPNEYIFNRLVHPSVGAYGKDSRQADKSVNITGCSTGQDRVFGRCGGIGLDIINLVYPLPADNFFFAENTNYAGYAEKAEELRRELDNFNKYSWHNNIYWTTVDIGRKYLVSASPVIPDSAVWQERKIKTALASWAAVQLPPDELSPYYERESGFGSIGPNELNFIEPETVYLSELLAKAKMLAETLLAIGVIEDTDYINREFRKLIGELETAMGLAEKTRRGEALAEADIEFIDELAMQYIVAKTGDKSFSLGGQSKQVRTVSIAGIRLLAHVYERDGRKYIAIGPVFEYEEK